MAIGDQLRQAVLLDAQQKVTAAVRTVLDETRAATPRGLTGVLADTERTEPVTQTGSGFVSAIEAPAPHAGFVDKGTRGGYVILPRRAKVLHWSDASGEHFASKVVHPGITARHFFSEPMAGRWHGALAIQFGA